MKLLEQCKAHGGPLTANSDDMKKLESLSEKQLLLEVSYIRCTLDPTIKQKRKVAGKFEKFSTEELKLQIKNCLLPEETVGSDLESLLMDILDSGESFCVPEAAKEKEPSLSCQAFGTTGWWSGPLGEEKLGVLLTSDSPEDWVLKAEIDPTRVVYH